MALTDSLISWWKLDEASGNALDAYGSETLTDHNSVGAASGARDFEVDNAQYFTRSDDAALSAGDIDFFFCARVKMESKGATRIILAKCSSAASDATIAYVLSYNSPADRYRFSVGNGVASNAAVLANSYGSPSAGVSDFIAVWHDATANTINIQVNDGTVDSQAYSAGSFDDAGLFSLGALTDSGSPLLSWDGLIGPVGFYKRVPSAGERTQLYGGAYPPGYASSATSAPSTSDTASRVLSAPRTATSAPSTSDTAARVVAAPRSLSEAPSTADTAARVVTAPRALAEAPSTADAASSIRNAVRTAADSPSTADAASRQTILARALTEAPATVDAAIAIVGASRVAAEAPSTADAVSPTKSALRSAAAAPSTADAAAFAGAFTRIVSAAPSTADVAALAGQTLTRALAEAPTTSDAAVRVLSAPRTATSAPSTADALARVLSAPRPLAEAPSTSQALTRHVVIGRTVSESPSTADVAAWFTFIVAPVSLYYAVPTTVSLYYAPESDEPVSLTYEVS